MHKIKKFQFGGTNDISNYTKYFNQNILKSLLPQPIIPDQNLMKSLTPKTVGALPLNLGANFLQREAADIFKPMTAKSISSLPLNLGTKSLETSKLGSIGSTAVKSPSSLTSALGIGSSVLDLAGAIGPKLDHTSGVNQALDIGSSIAGMIPGPWGQGIAMGLKAVNLLDKWTGKKAVGQATTGATATGYNLEFNPNASTSYGGLFGNKKRKQANTLTKLEDVSNIKKIGTSQAATQNNLAAANSTQDILNKNYNALSGFKSFRAISAKQGTKLELNKIKKLASGGKVNVIPSGALHRELNHLGGDHTRKGIPVILEKQGGEIDQQAEIERDELILNKSLTVKLEGLLKKYNDGNEDAAIEAGKILTYEILQNTKDNTGLLTTV